jgi:hypothetical protein
LKGIDQFNIRRFLPLGAGPGAQPRQHGAVTVERSGKTSGGLRNLDGGGNGGVEGCTEAHAKNYQSRLSFLSHEFS